MERVLKWIEIVPGGLIGVLPNGTNFASTMSSRTFTELDDMELQALWLHFEGPNSTR